MQRPLALMVCVRVGVISLAVVLAILDRLPWWFTGLVVLRDVVAAVVLVGHLRGSASSFRPDLTLVVSSVVTVVGLVTVAGGANPAGSLPALARVFGWACAWWGLALSWAALTDRLPDVRHLMTRRVRP